MNTNIATQKTAWKPARMNVVRAVPAFLIAGLVPLGYSVVASSDSSLDLATFLVLGGIAYLYSLFFVFVIGFVALFLSLKIKYGPFFIPVLVGGASGLLIGKLSYNAGTPSSFMMPLVIKGALTALVASLVYFLPEIRQRFSRVRSS
ncbi:hypothetical protein [Noviluteimonas gilva]|uniref:Uncharacterized protein n=1 Tax=Noviluteimonas gilva TaxID=2682097 RepID=A0A7C9HY74_9GAMM|nr:hypothetical protein [Lysobacter gilvus]MUV13834.1 hypothetical protein [Lysobacter gilvus]